jgi:hypothetical protein
VHLLINLRWFICWRLAARQIIARGGMGVPVAGQGERTALIQSEARRDDPQRTPTCFARSYDSVRCLKRTGTKASAQHNSFMRYVPRQPRTVVCVLVRLGRHINRGGDDGTAGRGDPRGKLKQSSSHGPRSSYQAGHGRARVRSTPTSTCIREAVESSSRHRSTCYLPRRLRLPRARCRTVLRLVVGASLERTPVKRGRRGSGPRPPGDPRSPQQ